MSAVVVVVGTTAPNTSADTSRPATYQGSSTTSAVELAVQLSGGTLSGTIAIAQASAMDGIAKVSRAHVTGARSGRTLTFNSTAHSAIGFVGTIRKNAIAGTIRQGSSSWRIQLQQSDSAATDFETDLSTLGARARSAHSALESAVAQLDARVALLEKATAALTADSSTMNTYLAQEVRDVRLARADAKKSLAKATASPPPAKSDICASVTKSVAAVAVVAHDAEFLAGFIHGLQGSIDSVSTHATLLTTSAQGLGLNIASRTVATTSLAGAQALASGVNSASSIVASSRVHVSRVANAADRDLSDTYTTTNSMIATAGCHRPLIEVSPFQTTVAA